MYRFIFETYHRLIEALSITKTRYLYRSFNINNRLTGLIGPRGVGKTTLLLQYIKNNLYNENKSFYFTADHVYFQKTTLLEFASQLHQREGFTVLFIDEIHKYVNWNQELKNLYDSFPDLKIVFSGSSMLDLVKGSYDLSRRAKLFHLKGLSFREYLNFVGDHDIAPIPFDQILLDPASHMQKIARFDQLFTHFTDYLKHGYYPFVFEDLHSYYEKLTMVIEKTVFEDIANYYNIKTQSLHYLKKLLIFVASIPPGEINIHNVAQNLGIDDKTTQHYFTILASVGLIRQIPPCGGGGKRIRKAAKVFTNNTTLMHALHQYIGQPVLKGTERELFFIQSLQDADHGIYFCNEGDYKVKDVLFEIGGKNKSRRQIKHFEGSSFLVKDDIMVPLKGEVPLLLVGFTY